ncbi:MAG: hypothetical protein LH474_09930 [Chamaesiphon sp.]|nr:hypothetical protein [Chamaesiphon sp.]
MSTNFSQSTPKVILLAIRVWNKFLKWIANNRLELIWVLYYMFEGSGYINAISQGKQTWLTSKTIDFNNISAMISGLFHMIILVGIGIYSLISKTQEIAELNKEQHTALPAIKRYTF